MLQHDHADPYPRTVTALRAAGCVFAEDEARLLISAAGHPAELPELIARRVAGLPLEQILGWASFAGRRFTVEPGVFVPRRRTEFLVHTATALARAATGRSTGPSSDRPTGLGADLGTDLGADLGTVPTTGQATGPLVVLDLGCGSGALGAALAAAVPVGELHATDVDPTAVRCARRNLAGLPATVYCGDLFEPLPATLRGRIDLLLANVPYVPTGKLALLPPEARDHEPVHALDGGADGLDLVRRVATAALQWLAPDGHLIVETSRDQAAVACGTFAGRGLAARVRHDLDYEATVVIGTRRPRRWRGSGAALRMGP